MNSRPCARGETATRAVAPERVLEPEFWRTARAALPGPKISIHLRVDTDVFEWFRRQGKGHLTRMNAVLRSNMEAHSKK